MTQTILLIEDNPDIMKINRSVLQEQGYSVLEAVTLSQGQHLLTEKKPDLILLDILMPDGSGLDFCRRIRDHNGIPILFLTALGENTDIVNGLRSGGDDYLAKPYDLDVLCARVEVLLRRHRPSEYAPLTFGSLHLTYTPREVFLGGGKLILKPKEFMILEYLMLHTGRYSSIEELYEKIWQPDTTPDIHTVWEHISRLRKKLNADPTVRIISTRGKGYQLVSDSHSPLSSGN